MNYYPFNIGDYAGNTRGLSLMEDLAYRRILDAYYQAEGPLTGDIARLVGMREQAEAVAYILATYFKETPEGWRNGRADEVIAEYHAKAERARQNGKGGGRPKVANPEKPSRFDLEPKSVPTETQSVQKQTDIGTGSKANQEPITKNQKKKDQEQGARATRLPQDWQPSPDDLAWARANRPEVDALAEADKFRDYWTAKNRDAAKLDWPATWRNWIRNSHAPPRRGTPNAAPSKQMQGLANILGLTHENDDPSRMVLDLNPTGFGADLRQLPSGFPGG